MSCFSTGFVRVVFGLLLFASLGPPGASAAADSEVDAVLTLLPEDRRAGATVVSFATGERVVVRPGTGRAVCEVDLPGDGRFSASCYHAALEPYFLRARELAAAGTPTDQARERMARELGKGELAVPVGAYQVHVSGDRPAPDVLPSRVEVTHLVYLPMRDAGDVGLPAEAPGEGPWLHNAGTIDSHVMWSEERDFPW